MAGFEVVVRPVIFPNIRPAQRQSVVPAETDPEKGIAVIRGSSARTVDLSDSTSFQYNNTHAKEKQRRVDVVRVYQKDEAGDTPDDGDSEEGGGGGGGGKKKKNYVDLEVANQITMQDGSGAASIYNYAPVAATANVDILNKNQIRRAP